MAFQYQSCNDMSTPSNWPLPQSSVRFLVPKPIIKDLTVNTLSSGLYPLAFGYYENAHEHKIERVNHDDHLIIFCADGVGWIDYDNKTLKLSKNQLLILPKGVQHRYRADKDNPWSIYWVHLLGHLFDAFMDNIGLTNRPLVVPIDDPSLLEEEFQQLLVIREQSYQLNYFILASNILKKMLAMILSFVHLEPSAKTKDLNIENFDLYLKENITRTLSLNDMADAVGLSKFYFAKKFQATTGISPGRYYLEKKIQHACFLLDSTKHSVKHVSANLGYDDPYYFSRLFKKVMGLSPKQYRQSKHGH